MPIIALSQLSRNLETRADKRPMLSDLRESGCLTADTRLVRADTNDEVTLGELVESGATDVPVWSLDEHYRLVAGHRDGGVLEWRQADLHGFGCRSGRVVDASATTRSSPLGGWDRLDELTRR